MRVCFVGLGSIARRHIRNLCDLMPNVQIDVLRHSVGKEIPEDVSDLICSVYNEKGQLDEHYDVVFITNPTSKHYDTLKELSGYSRNFFIEKPVFVSGNEDIGVLRLQSDGIYYVACPLRYTNVIQYLKNNLDVEKVYAVRAIASSYLPEWRPGADYRTTYSAKKALGGGVSIDLIHEWDYLFDLFGTPKQVKSIITKKSNLEIDSDDIAVYIAEYERYVVELHLDYFGRVPIRKLEILMDEDTIEADLIEQRIWYRYTGEVLEYHEERDDWQKRELQHFFSIAKRESVNDNSIEKACSVLRLARGEEVV